MSIATTQRNLLDASWLDMLFMEINDRARNDCTQNFVASLKFLTQLYCRAITAFLGSDLQSFDAQVGENACELRMFILLRFYDSADLRAELSTDLLSFQDMLLHIEKLDVADLVTKRSTRGTILSDMPDIKVSSCLLFLVNAKFLSENNYNADLHIFSFRMYKKQQRRMQVFLSAWCVSYMQTCISEESNYLNDHLVSFASSKFVYIDDSGRAGLPCYFTLKSLMMTMWREKRVLLFKCFTRKSTLDGGPCHFLVYEPTELLLQYKRVPLIRHLDSCVAVFEVKVITTPIQFVYKLYTLYFNRELLILTRKCFRKNSTQ